MDCECAERRAPILAQPWRQLSQLHAGLGVLEELGGQLQRGFHVHGHAVVPVLCVLLMDDRLGLCGALAGLHMEGMQRGSALSQLAGPRTGTTVVSRQVKLCKGRQAAHIQSQRVGYTRTASQIGPRS